MLFIILAIALVGCALWLLLPALLKTGRSAGGAQALNIAVHRDQLREAERDLAAGLMTPDRFEQARSEIQRRVLEDTADAEPAAVSARPARTTAIALALLIPLGSALLYWQLDRPRTGSALSAAPAEPQAAGGPDAQQIAQMAATLAERLKTDDGNGQGWQMLGRTYSAIGRFAEAVAALRRAAVLLPADAGVLTDLAEAIGLAQGRRLAGEPTGLLQQALALDAKHAKALALAGSAAFEAGDPAGARGLWERLLATLPADSEIARSLRVSIDQARDAKGPDGAAAQAVPSAASAGLSGTVTLSPALAGRVAAGDTVFVYVRAAQGPRMPLAIVRSGAADLPHRFTLDDAMAMSPELRLSGQAKVVVVARISKSGQAAPQPGDLFGQTPPVPSNSRGLALLIDKVAP